MKLIARAMVACVLFLPLPATNCTKILGQESSVPTSQEELAFSAVARATNPAARIAAAEDFVAKFPKSNKRPEVARLVSEQLPVLRNARIALKLVERAQAIFTSRSEMAFFEPVALDVYINAGRIDQAFALAAQVLSKNEDLSTLVRMTYLGALEARKRNLKFAESSIRYGQTAINIIETRSSSSDNAGSTQKDIAIHLPSLYQQIGIIMLALGKTAEAKKQLLQSIALGPKDPSSYALIGRVLNGEYEEFNNAYREMAEGSDKQAAKKKLDALLDEIIDAYAHAVGLATGKEEHQALLQQVVPDLTSYYKYRNNGSTVGLRTLIQKYRD